MKQITLETRLTVFDSLNELAAEDKKLIEKAFESMKKAYAPYSSFRVGAAVLLENGEIIQGNNQENAAYPSGLCAERVAVFYAGARWPGVKILKLAVAASSELSAADLPVPPCGACRQSVLEYEVKQDEPIEILFTGASGPIVKSKGMQALLPMAFQASFLPKP